LTSILKNLYCCRQANFASKESIFMKKAELVTFEKMRFDEVNAVFDVLHYAFHPEGYTEEEGLDNRMLALWNMFLCSVGWTEEEYWETLENSCECEDHEHNHEEENDEELEDNDQQKEAPSAITKAMDRLKLN
jgi:hypothetical protein